MSRYDIGGIHDPMGNAFHTALTADIPGSTVLITGCGPIGIFAVGICKAAGASRIIASDVNETRLDAGAQHGRARRRASRATPKRRCKRATDGLGVDVVLEMSGVPSAIHQAFALVRVGGRVQMLGIPAKPMEIELRHGGHLQGHHDLRRRRAANVRHVAPDDAIPALRGVRSDAGDHAPLSARAVRRGDRARSRSGEAGKVIFEIA